MISVDSLAQNTAFAQKERADFPGFNAVYAEYFPEAPPARSALVSDFLVDVRIEIEVIAYKPETNAAR